MKTIITMVKKYEYPRKQWFKNIRTVTTMVNKSEIANNYGLIFYID